MIHQEIKGIHGDEGGYNPGHLWKLKKKFSPKHSEPPIGMKDGDGNILTNEEEIKAQTVKHYKKVFDDRPMDNKYRDYKLDKEKPFNLRLETA